MNMKCFVLIQANSCCLAYDSVSATRFVTCRDCNMLYNQDRIFWVKKKILSINKGDWSKIVKCRTYRADLTAFHLQLTRTACISGLYCSSNWRGRKFTMITERHINEDLNMNPLTSSSISPPAQFLLRIILHVFIWLVSYAVLKQFYMTRALWLVEINSLNVSIDGFSRDTGTYHCTWNNLAWLVC